MGQLTEAQRSGLTVEELLAERDHLWAQIDEVNARATAAKQYAHAAGIFAGIPAEVMDGPAEQWPPVAELLRRLAQVVNPSHGA